MKHKNRFEDWLIYEDDDFLVINKPPYVSTLEDRASPISVLALAREYHPASQVCHRLDKETSGILLLAKNSDAYRHANSQFSNRSVDKVYHALVDGIHDFNDRKIDLDLHVAGSGAVRVSRGAKPSITFVTTLDRYKQHSLVECKPVTGRMHQIRVHMAAANAPLVADLIYGGKDLLLSSIKKKYRPKPDQEERPIMPRVALHAFALKFSDLKDQSIYLECPYPKDFQNAVNQLDKFR